MQEYIESMIELQSNVILYIDNDGDENEEYFNNIMNFVNSSKNQSSRFCHKDFLFLLSKIINNHHWNESFYNKIEKILLCFKNVIKQNFSNLEIFQIFRKNKVILLFLIKNKIIEIDQSIFKKMLKHNNEFNYLEFFFPEIKTFLLPSRYENIKKIIFDNENITINDNEPNEIFEKKREKGQNDYYICQLIQQDSIVEFVTYINQRNIPLSSTIKPSIFESNLFLLEQTDVTLIEYATFYGSLQIFNYLRMNGVDITRSLWYYSIHGRNADIIHYLEEKINTDSIRKKILYESMKCYHEELVEYIRNNYYGEKEKIEYKVKFMNFSYFPNDLYDEDDIYYLCKYDCYDLVKIYFESFLPKIKIMKRNPINIITKLNNSKIVDLFLINLKYSKKESGMSLFDNCLSLTHITFPSSLTEIDSWSFNRCSSLKTIILSSSIETIGEYSFYGCNSLSQVIFNCESSLKTIGNHSFHGCCSLNQITIPSTVSSIGEYSFGSCSSLKQIEIPSSLTSIEDYLFYECSNLSQVIFQSNSSLISIGNFSFVRCVSLKEITIPPLVTSIGNNAFEGCSSLTNLSVPSSISFIGNGCFLGCSSLHQKNYI